MSAPCASAHDVVAGAGVAGEHDRAVRRVDAEPERREHRRVLDEGGADGDAAVVLGVDDHRLHRRRRGRRGAAVGDDAEVDVGDVVVAADPDLADADRIGDVVAPLVGHAQVDVVGERLPEVLDGAAQPRRRLEREGQRSLAPGRERRDRQPGGRRPEGVDHVRRPAALGEVGEIHDVVGVQVRDEQRPHQRPSSGEALADRQAGPPQLAVHPFAAVDEVDGIADDHGVGVAAACRLRVCAASGPQQDQPGRRVRWTRCTWFDEWHHGLVKVAVPQAA